MSIFFKNLINRNKKKFLFIAELSANHAGDLKMRESLSNFQNKMVQIL